MESSEGKIMEHHSLLLFCNILLSLQMPPLYLANTDAQPNNLASSGIELVLAHTMYAIVGAISLEKGGLVANKVTRERILEPLGF